MYAGHLDLTQPLVWTVDDALTPAECAAYTDRRRTGNAEVAPVITTLGVEIDLAVRSNTRVMWDDGAEADRLVAKVRSVIPGQLSGHQLVGGNPRIRVYRYGPGERAVRPSSPSSEGDRAPDGPSPRLPAPHPPRGDAGHARREAGVAHRHSVSLAGI